MNGPKLAAVALTLIICCPIIMGYGLASHEEELEREVVTSSNSLTDYILNSESDYMMSYTGPNNNSSLLRHVYAEGQWDSKLIAPDYVSTGSTYSSIPTYEESEDDGSWTTASISTAGSYSWSSQDTGTYTNSSERYMHNTTAGTYGGIEIGYDQYVSWYNCLDLSTLGEWGVLRIGMNYTAGPISIRCSDSSVTALYNDAWYGSQTSAALVLMREGSNGVYSYEIYDETSGTLYSNITWLAIYGNRAQSYALTYNDTPAVSSVPDFVTLTMPKGVPGVVGYVTSDDRQVYVPFLYPSNTATTPTAELRFNTLYIGGSNYGTVKSWGVAYLTATPAVTTGELSKISARSLTIEAASHAGTSYITFPSSTYVVVSTTGAGSRDTWFASLDSSYQMIQNGADTIRFIDEMYGDFSAHDVRFYNYGSSGSYSVRFKEAIPISISQDVWNMPYSNEHAYTLRISYTDGTPDLYLSDFEGLTGIGKSYTYWSIGNDAYTNVAAVRFAPIMAYDAMTYSYTVQTINGYADPAYGWRSTAYSGHAYYNDWLNYYENEYIRMMVHMPSGADLYIKDRFDGDNIVRIKDDGGIWVSWTRDGVEKAPALGSYRDLMVELNAKTDEVTVTGITSWPAMYTSPQPMNSITVPYDFDGYIESFTLAVVSGEPTFRVDRADILAGQFATTRDFTLNLPDLFPGNDYQQIYLNSIGVYGTSLSLNGKPHEVTDGRITITTTDGTNTKSVTVGLNHATIGIDTSGDTPVITINGYRVVNDLAGGTASADVVFGGEWSLTLTRQAIGTETYTKTSWTPGEFALDMNGFVLVMVLVAVGAFVVLGMTGARSGAKIGLLALICGGAAAIGLIML